MSDMADAATIDNTHIRLVANQQFQNAVLVEVKSGDGIGIGILIWRETPHQSEGHIRHIILVCTELLPRLSYSALQQDFQLSVIVNIRNGGKALARHVSWDHQWVAHCIVVHIPYVCIHCAIGNIGVTHTHKNIQMTITVEVGHLCMTVACGTSRRCDLFGQTNTVASHPRRIGDIHRIRLIAQYQFQIVVTAHIGHTGR